MADDKDKQEHDVTSPSDVNNGDDLDKYIDYLIEEANAREEADRN